MVSDWPATEPPLGADGGRGMGNPLKVVVVDDTHAVISKTAEDFERIGYEPAVFLAPSEEEFLRIAPDCELVVARSDAMTVPARRVLELAASQNGLPPVLVCADSYTEDEIVTLIRAGARDRASPSFSEPRRPSTPGQPLSRPPTPPGSGSASRCDRSGSVERR